MAQLSPFRVKLWSVDTAGATPTRGRLNQVAVIDDATDVGVSEYANEPGETFFTLPMNHPQIAECKPLERHYEVSRRNASGTYEIMGSGILDDQDATANEVIFYGTNHLGMLSRSITATNQSYTNTLVGTIINNQFTDAQGLSTWRHYVKGTIDATTRSVTVITTFEERLGFWRGLLEILAAGGTTRPIMSVSRSYPATFSFNQNKGSDKENVRLEYGGAVLDFRQVLGYQNRATNIRAIGIKREGAAILYSSQTYGDPTTFGRLYMSGLFQDVINQAELDDLALSTLKDAYERSGNLVMSLAQGYLVPWDGWDLGDSVRVVISRGIVSINALYTVWGMEWIGKKDGSESLYLDLQPKLT